MRLAGQSGAVKVPAAEGTAARGRGLERIFALATPRLASWAWGMSASRWRSRLTKKASASSASISTPPGFAALNAGRSSIGTIPMRESRHAGATAASRASHIIERLVNVDVDHCLRADAAEQVPRAGSSHVRGTAELWGRHCGPINSCALNSTTYPGCTTKSSSRRWKRAG